MSAAYLSEIEAGKAHPGSTVLSALATALGLRFTIRLEPGAGPLVRDHIQARIVEAVLRALDPRWRRFVEVAVHRPVRGWVDLVLDDPSADMVVAAEVHSQLRRLEEQARWASAKAAALHSSELGAAWAGQGRAPAVSRLLILRSTRATRELAAVYAETLRSLYPARVADAHAALTAAGVPWPGDALLWAAVDGRSVQLMARPPNGVRLGR